MRFLTPYSFNVIKQITSVGISAEDTAQFSGYVPSDLVQATSFTWSGDTLTINLSSSTFTERKVKSIFLLQGNEPRGIIVEDTIQIITCKVMQIIATFNITSEGVELFTSTIDSGPYLNTNNSIYKPISGKVVVPNRATAESLNHGQIFRKGLIVHENKTYDIPLTFQRFNSEILGIVPVINQGRPIIHLRTTLSEYLLFLDTRTGYKYASGNPIDGFTLADISDQSMLRGTINCTSKYDYLNNVSVSSWESSVFSDMWEMLSGDDDILVLGQNEVQTLSASYANLTEALGQNVKDSSIYRYIYNNLVIVTRQSFLGNKIVMLNQSQGYFRIYEGKFKIFPYQGSLMFYVRYQRDDDQGMMLIIENFIDTQGNTIFDLDQINLNEAFPIELFGKNFLIMNSNTLVYIDE